MNEVRTSALTSQISVRPASSKGLDEKQGSTVTGGDSSVAAEKVAKAAESAAKEISSESLKSAVASINDFVQLVQRDLHFTVDDELDRTVVKVVDSHSGKLIRQIPEDVFLELARSLKDSGELHLVNALG